MGDMRNAYMICVGKPERNRPLRRLGRRRDDNIRMDRKEIRWEGVDWIHLTHYRNQEWDLLNTAMNRRVS
jgi:hypothetical protein